VGALEGRRHDERGGWRGGTVVAVLTGSRDAVDDAAPTTRRPVAVFVVVNCRRAKRRAAVLGPRRLRRAGRADAEGRSQDRYVGQVEIGTVRGGCGAISKEGLRGGLPVGEVGLGAVEWRRRHWGRERVIAVKRVVVRVRAVGGSSDAGDSPRTGRGSLQDARREHRIRVHGVRPRHSHPLSLVLHSPVLEPDLRQEHDSYAHTLGQKADVPKLDGSGGGGWRVRFPIYAEALPLPPCADRL
jgi:hypothetical protein